MRYDQAANNDPVVQGGRVVRDNAGTDFRVTETPRRIVSLAPNLTEILFALGLGDRVVGVTRYCDYPADARAIEKIGGLLDPDVEKIRSLRPDLVVAFRGNPWDAVERLRSLRLRVFVLDIGRTLDDVPRTIAALGRITLRDTAAAALSATLGDKARAVARTVAAAPGKPRVFVMLQGLGLSTCGGASYLSDLLERAGGVNVAAGIRRDWLEYGRERLIQDDPDIILVLAPSEADFARSRAWLEAQPGIRDLRAVRTGRVRRLDENMASRFGPRLYDALAEIVRLLR